MDSDKNSQPEDFRRVLARERNKINAEIFELIHESKALVDQTRQNQSQNCHSTVEETNGFYTKLREFGH